MNVVKPKTSTILGIFICSQTNFGGKRSIKGLGWDDIVTIGTLSIYKSIYVSIRSSYCTDTENDDSRNKQL